MKRNAFIISKHGQVFHYEPDFKRPLSKDTVLFLDGLDDVSGFDGCAVCLSAAVAIDSLLSLLEIVKGELADRAKNQLDELTVNAKSAGTDASEKTL